MTVACYDGIRLKANSGSHPAAWLPAAWRPAESRPAEPHPAAWRPAEWSKMRTSATAYLGEREKV
ncbi:hypothetical protein AYJ66_12085 [Dietzia cinnamea]|nr:hypothetical protein AYJ66_12085 [Dietzia cinnamea]